uniref:Uncharacterized protein n=1 Tax=Rhizophora mucronata TaxID=61149 RepID=A0A2P2JV84_RHIMU
MLSALSSLGRASEVFMRGTDHSYYEICHLMQSNFAYMSSFKLVIKQRYVPFMNHMMFKIMWGIYD